MCEYLPLVSVFSTIVRLKKIRPTAPIFSAIFAETTNLFFRPKHQKYTIYTHKKLAIQSALSRTVLRNTPRQEIGEVSNDNGAAT